MFFHELQSGDCIRVADVQSQYKHSYVNTYAWLEGVITKRRGELTADEQRKLKRLGQIVRKERERQGLTLYDIEDRGYSFYQHWQAVEGGKKNVTFTTLLSICKVLRIHPSDLIKGL